jgi:hypothetical protein
VRFLISPDTLLSVEDTLQSLRRAEPHYFKFVLSALAGKNADSYFRDYEVEIREFAKALQTVLKPEACDIYRGILLDPLDCTDGLLKPLDHKTFLSFSERKEVAEYFADVYDPMSPSMKKQNPNYRGYVIAHRAQPEEILFHWKWTKELGLHRYISTDTVSRQAEVILFQGPRAFRLLPFSR